MSTGFVPPHVRIANKAGLMESDWYRFLQELYQWSGLAGPQFPLYAESIQLGHGLVADGVNPPTFGTFSGNIGAWSCPDGGTSRVHGCISVPRGYTSGTELVPFVRWAPAGAGSGDVIWEFEYSAADAGGAFPAATTLTITSSAAGALVHQHAAGTAITGLEPGALVAFSVRRYGASVDDTYNDAAFLLGAGLILQASAHGTQAQEP